MACDRVSNGHCHTRSRTVAQPIASFEFDIQVDKSAEDLLIYVGSQHNSIMRSDYDNV